MSLLSTSLDLSIAFSARFPYDFSVSTKIPRRSRRHHYPQPQKWQSWTILRHLLRLLNNSYNLVLSASLQTTVANSQLRASNQQIQLAASQNYYTQDRMVTGEDYNVFPLTNTQALKVKAINRTYSGQSRFLNINDPTGTYQNIKLVSTDGILYVEPGTNKLEVSVANTQNSLALITNYIQPMLTGSQRQQRIAQEVKDFYYYYYPRANLQSQGTTVWKTATSSSQISTGAFYKNNNAQPVWVS